MQIRAALTDAGLMWLMLVWWDWYWEDEKQKSCIKKSRFCFDYLPSGKINHLNVKETAWYAKTFLKYPGWNSRFHYIKAHTSRMLTHPLIMPGQDNRSFGSLLNPRQEIRTWEMATIMARNPCHLQDWNSIFVSNGLCFLKLNRM